MKELLSKLFFNSINLGEEAYSNNQIKSKWLGNKAATVKEISETEKRLEVSLPEDYKEMLLIANGFPTSNWSIEPSFQKVDQIDYYRNSEQSCIEEWSQIDELKKTVKELRRAIMIAGLEEGQQFLLIPPIDNLGKWSYWKFAMWIPGEEVFDSLFDYLNTTNQFIEKLIKEKTN